MYYFPKPPRVSSLQHMSFCGGISHSTIRKPLHLQNRPHPFHIMCLSILVITTAEIFFWFVQSFTYCLFSSTLLFPFCIFFFMASMSCCPVMWSPLPSPLHVGSFFLFLVSSTTSGYIMIAKTLALRSTNKREHGIICLGESGLPYLV